MLIPASRTDLEAYLLFPKDRNELMLSSKTF
jgi:hypothetical protein